MADEFIGEEATARLLKLLETSLLSMTMTPLPLQDTEKQLLQMQLLMLALVSGRKAFLREAVKALRAMDPELTALADLRAFDDGILN